VKNAKDYIMLRIDPRVPSSPTASPLVLCDRLISLAEDAERAGLRTTAAHLVELIEEIFEEKPHHDA
jgi:hypothetical protein